MVRLWRKFPIVWQSGRALLEELALRCMVFSSGARWKLGHDVRLTVVYSLIIKFLNTQV
jgi:hypothetical protein